MRVLFLFCAIARLHSGQSLTNTLWDLSCSKVERGAQNVLTPPEGLEAREMRYCCTDKFQAMAYGSAESIGKWHEQEAVKGGTHAMKNKPVLRTTAKIRAVYGVEKRRKKRRRRFLLRCARFSQSGSNPGI